MTSSDRFPVPVRSAVKSNLTDWCFQNLSKRAFNALTVQASTTELGKLFQIFTMRAEKKCSVYKRQIYQIAESNKIKSKFFCPNCNALHWSGVVNSWKIYRL